MNATIREQETQLFNPNLEHKAVMNMLINIPVFKNISIRHRLDGRLAYLKWLEKGAEWDLDGIES